MYFLYSLEESRIVQITEFQARKSLRKVGMWSAHSPMTDSYNFCQKTKVYFQPNFFYLYELLLGDQYIKKPCSGLNCLYFTKTRFDKSHYMPHFHY